MQPVEQKARYCGSSANDPDAVSRSTSPVASGRVYDPVCGMMLAASTAKSRAEHDGKTYYFCCGGCQAKFLANPSLYMTRTDRPAPPNVPSPPVAHGAIYTCPMHPQIKRNKAGSCPICGMALEPQGIPEAEGRNPELRDMTRRFFIGALLAAPIFVLEMGGHLAVQPDGTDEEVPLDQVRVGNTARSESAPYFPQ